MFRHKENSHLPPTGSRPDGPLSGIRVLDVATVLAAPLCAQILGDFGADVIKVEHPEGGDSLRGHGRSKHGYGLWWKTVGRNKRTVAIDLSVPAGAELLRRLASTSDVLVENFRPGTLERWGLGWEDLHALNPQLVMVRVTGFGQTGPYSRRPAFGTLIEAMSGFAAVTGEPGGPPTLPPFGLADSVAGITAALATLMALYHRDVAGGGGQMVDLSILESMVSVLGPGPTIYDQLGEVPQRMGNRSVNNAPRNAYRTADRRWVVVSTSANRVAERVARLVGHPELVDEPWFATGAGRAAHADLLDQVVGEWIGRHSEAQVAAAFNDADAAVAPVYDVARLVDDPQVLHRGMVTTLEDADLGPIRMLDVLFRLSSTPGRVRFPGRTLGADTQAVLVDELGMGTDEIERLRKEGTLA